VDETLCAAHQPDGIGRRACVPCAVRVQMVYTHRQIQMMALSKVQSSIIKVQTLTNLEI
jgi:hypothetical protein